MNKDVIYIDVEDDITAIIGKVKSSKEKVVALVPPKRVGVLQSAVNLRLLNRAAQQSKKHLALVTNNHSLIALAAAASIPVAKNLQSKPELAEVPALAVDDEDDIIEGGDLPIGEHAKQAESPVALAAVPTDDDTPVKPKAKSGKKVPNFNRFRKRLLLAIAAGLLLIAFLVWALFFAARATVVISAKTTSSSINLPVTLTTEKPTDNETNTIRAIVKEQEDETSVEFTATGKKDAGSKATGDVEFTNSSLNERTVDAGTKLRTSGDLVFVTSSSVTVPAASLGNCGGQACVVNGSATVEVAAAENGSKYNAASGNLSGAPSGLSASFTSPTSGGVTKNVTVVSESDVQKAKNEVADGAVDDIRAALKEKFSDEEIAIDESFQVNYGDTQVSPRVGDEASTATLSATVTYKLYGANKEELDTFLDAYMKQEIDGRDDQRVYKNGADSVVFEDASKATNGAKATLVATAQIGPKIDDDDVKNQSRGKRFGEIQQNLEAIQGVDGVDVKFFPFWVSSVPDDPSRISVEFKLDESN